MFHFCAEENIINLMIIIMSMATNMDMNMVKETIVIHMSTTITTIMAMRVFQMSMTMSIPEPITKFTKDPLWNQ